MDTVVLVHPDLPGQEITVQAASVHHYERSGWQQKSPDQPPTDDTETE